MQSLQWTTGLITLAMLLNICQMGTSSPAGSRPQTQIMDSEGNRTTPVTTDENISNDITTEDSIIDEVTFNIEGRKLHPRMRPLQKIKTIVDFNADLLKTNDTDLLTKMAIESDLNQDLPSTKNNTQSHTNSEIKKDTDVEVQDGENHTLPRIEPFQTKEAHNIDLPSTPNTDLSESNDTSLLTKFANETDNANVQLNMSNIEKKTDIENKQDLELSPEDKLILKHNHLTNLLFSSISNGDLSNTNGDLQADQEQNLNLREKPLSRMITEPEDKEGEKGKHEFQGRSDLNLTKEIPSHDQITVDRSFEIDASGIDEDGDIQSPNMSSNANEIPEENTNEGEGNQEGSGFLHFLKSLFGL